MLNNLKTTFVEPVNNGDSVGMSVEISEKECEKILKYGENHYRIGNFKEAEKVFLAYASYNPYDYRGAFNLGALYITLSEFEKALLCFKTLTNNPYVNWDKLCLNISYCHFMNLDMYEAYAYIMLVKKEVLPKTLHERYDNLHFQLSKIIEG